MGLPVNKFQPPQAGDDLRQGLQGLNIALFNWALSVVQRLNTAIIDDGSKPMSQPLVLAQFPTVSLPNPALWKGAIVYDSTTNTVKRSNGAAWANVP